MSMALLVGAILAYPMNWWLVSYHLKHGMMTVRAKPVAAHVHGAPAAAPAPEMQGMDMGRKPTPYPPVPVMTLLSFAAFAVGLAIAWLFGSM